MKGWCWLVGFLGVWLPAFGQPAGGALNGWQPDALLSTLMLRDLVQAPGGLLWVATDDGVYRYDGTALVALNTLRRGGARLPAVNCYKLLVLPDGALWLGTEAGLYRFGPDGTLAQLPLPAPAAADRTVEGLALSPDGRRVWANQGNDYLQAYTLAGQPTGPVLPSPGHARSILPAADGTLWLWRIDPDNVYHLSATGRLLGQWYTPGRRFQPLADPAGRVWLVSARAQYRPGPAGQLVPEVRWPALPPAGYAAAAAAAATDDDADDEQVVSAWHGPDGPVLLGRGGVRQASWAGGALRLQFGLPLPQGIVRSTTTHLRGDGSRHWWVFDSRNRGCWHRTAVRPFICGLAGPGGGPYSVRAIQRLPDGRLAVASYGHGLLVQAADSPLAPLRVWRTAGTASGTRPVPMAIVPARPGAARPGAGGPGASQPWLTGGASAFLSFDPRTGHMAELAPPPGAGPASGVLCLAPDTATGAVWGGARSGLYRYDAARRAFCPFAPGPGRPVLLAGRVVEAVCPAGPGRLWAATPEGVEQLDPATGAHRLFGPGAAAGPAQAALDGARCLYLAPNGRLWVGTRAHGLGVVEPDGRARLVLGVAQGLPSASVATLTPGPDGALWLGTYQGLVRFEPATGKFAVFTTAQGLLSDECNAASAYLDPAVPGSLLVGGVAGLHRINLRQVPAPGGRQPRLCLTALTTLTAAGTRTRYQLAADGRPALALSTAQPLLDLHLALADDPDPGRARYAYRVPGWLGGRWLELGTTPLLRLQGLPPGRYTLQIKAETSQGRAAAAPLRLPLTVTAAWWNRPLTWALFGLAAAVAAGAGVYGWQRTRLRRVQRENALRARLAADLHDEIGGLLTRVTMQAELLRELEQGPAASLAALVEDSRAAASSVRDIIWSVDAEADTLGALAARIHDQLLATGRATGRVLLFAGPALAPAGPDPALPPVVRQHTYRIFKEALTNALKHSRPGSPIAVALAHVPALRLSVCSEGRPALHGRAGQGLRNLRLRAAQMGATLSAGPTPDGWEVLLVLV